MSLVDPHGPHSGQIMVRSEWTCAQNEDASDSRLISPPVRDPDARPPGAIREHESGEQSTTLPSPDQNAVGLLTSETPDPLRYDGQCWIRTRSAESWPA